MTLQIRWLGRVDYSDALALQRGLFRGDDDHLLLLEHPPTYTLGLRARDTNVLVDPASVGATLEVTDRGGDVTYHGPGQLVGYPILTVPGKRGGGMADTAAYVCGVEQLVIDACAHFGLAAARLSDHPGVWIEPESVHARKICAIGVRLSRTRSMHGFALNVDPDMDMFDHIVPCGIADKGVTSLAAEGVDASMGEVVDVVARLAEQRWGAGSSRRADVAWRAAPGDLSPFSRGEGPGAPSTPSPSAASGAAPVQVSGRLARRMEEAGVGAGLDAHQPKPDFVKARVRITDGYRRLRSTMRDLDLVTVCEEAGCPNIFECWADGTATFMVAGERCTRKCGFCLVDTRHPRPLDPREPERVAEAVERMDLRYAVITMVARDDLDDGAAGHVADVVAAIRERCPDTSVETLISDCRGDATALGTIFAARPDVLNHNVETVPRLQRMVRPSASYARSLAVLARARAADLVTKSSLIVGLGERDEEIELVLRDLAALGTDIVTIGQYLSPTTNHLPVARWVEPERFERWAEMGRAFGIAHVEASPLTRSSYHAREAEQAALG